MDGVSFPDRLVLGMGECLSGDIFLTVDKQPVLHQRCIYHVKQEC